MCLFLMIRIIILQVPGSGLTTFWIMLNVVLHFARMLNMALLLKIQIF